MYNTTMDYWTQSLDDGYLVDIVYLDRKASDSVPHNRLLMKLKAYGILSMCILNCFLVESRELSLTVTTLVGPWGSILGPLLFLLCVNDIPLSVDPTYYLLMMPRCFDQLDAKPTTCNFNVILLNCINGQKPGCSISILASVTFCV